MDFEPPPPEAPVNLEGLVPAELVRSDGIYFDMPDSEYHASFGLSSSGVKDFRVSPLLWWAKSALNPNQADVLAEEVQTEGKELGSAFDARITCGREYFNARYAQAITHDDYPNSLRTTDDLKGWLEERGLKKTGKTKAELIARVLENDPTAQIFEAIQEGYYAGHKGKTFLEAKWLDKIEVAARMVDAHPELSKAFTGGCPQVSVFYHCEKTGVPIRVRYDYLKARLITDLKTLLLRGDLPAEQAIGKEIGFRRYYIQAHMYREAAKEIPRLIKAGKVFGTPPAGFLEALLKHPDKEWAWVFSCKGPAPAAYGYILPKQSMLWQLAEVTCDTVKHSWRHHLEVYGRSPWIEPSGFKALDDTMVPSWSLT